MLFQIFINLPCKYVQICIQSSPGLESGFCAAKKTKTREKNKLKTKYKSQTKAQKNMLALIFFALEIQII